MLNANTAPPARLFEHPVRLPDFEPATSATQTRQTADSRPVSPDTGAQLAWQWLAAALDELDYGILLLVDGAHAAHVNHAARVELDGAHPLLLLGGRLRARSAHDVAPLHDALAQASLRGLRRLLSVGDDAQRTSISIVPLELPCAGSRAVLVILGKNSVCESLSVEGFARAHGLTGAETRVLAALCTGAEPAEVACQLGVAISTIRSQIGSVRMKTGAPSIRALVQQVAVLPPLKGVLRGVSREAYNLGLQHPLVA
jgi:DNA-binding CsgD family transcriptional regulator